MSMDLELQTTANLVHSKNEQTKLYKVLIDHTHVIDCNEKCAVYPCSECHRAQDEEYEGKCPIECDDYGFIISTYFQDIVANAYIDEQTGNLVLSTEDKKRLHSVKPFAMVNILFGRTMREIAGRGFTLQELTTVVYGGEQIENIKLIPNPALNAIDRLLKLIETLKTSILTEKAQSNDLMDQMMKRFGEEISSRKKK